jgi:hypothetical protein
MPIHPPEATYKDEPNDFQLLKSFQEHKKALGSLSLGDPELSDCLDTLAILSLDKHEDMIPFLKYLEAAVDATLVESPEFAKQQESLAAIHIEMSKDSDSTHGLGVPIQGTLVENPELESLDTKIRDIQAEIHTVPQVGGLSFLGTCKHWPFYTWACTEKMGPIKTWKMD